MEENNDHILMQAIKELPVHSPDKFVWDRLETDLFSFPVNELPLHQPDANLWEIIEKTLSHQPPSKNNLRKGLLLVALLLITFVGFLKYQQYNNVAPYTPIEFFVDNQKPAMGGYDLKSVQEPILQSGQLVQTDVTKKLARNESTPIIQTGRLGNPESKQMTILRREANVSYAGDIFVSETEKHPISITGLSLRKGTLTLESPELIPQRKDDLPCSSYTGTNSYFSVGIIGRFDQFLEGNRVDGTKLQDWNSLDIELSYHPGKIFFTTGVGAVFSSDNSEITYNYLQNELINSYIYVDSVYYDPISGTTQFFTTTVDVYDSIEYADKAQFKSQYKYVKVPFIVGVELYSDKHFSVSLSGGISWLHLIQNNLNYPSLYRENARILNSSYQKATRTKELFQISTQLDIHYHLSQHLVLKLGPMFNYFTNSMYQNGKPGNPYSWSIRAGIQYNF